MSLSNTTLLVVEIYIYIYIYNLLHKFQLHVSALEMAIFRLRLKNVSSYTRHVGCILWGGKR